jgi:hypothetical protein
LSGIGGGTFVGDDKSLVVYDRKKMPRLRCSIAKGHPNCTAEHFLESVRNRSVSRSTNYVFENIESQANQDEIALTVNDYQSQEVLKRAQEARRLHNILNHPNDQDLCTALDNGCYPKCSVTSGDVKAAARIFGPCVACIAGKLKLDPQRLSSSEPARSIGEKVHFDFIPLPGPSLGSNMHIVVALDEFSNYCVGIPVVSKPLVFSALKAIIGKFTREGHTVKAFASDNEPVIRAAKPNLEALGVKLTQTPSGFHEKRVERFIQTVKGKYRSLLASLPCST